MMVDNLREQAETDSKAPPRQCYLRAEGKNTVTVSGERTGLTCSDRNASSVSEFVLTVTFVPFLVYFMLSWQDHVRTASVMLFSMENRNTAYVMLGLIAAHDPLVHRRAISSSACS